MSQIIDRKTMEQADKDFLENARITFIPFPPVNEKQNIQDGPENSHYVFIDPIFWDTVCKCAEAEGISTDRYVNQIIKLVLL